MKDLATPLPVAVDCFFSLLFREDTWWETWRERMWKRKRWKEEMEKEVGGEEGREGGRDGGVKVQLSPLKLVEEAASPFWVWSITFAGHLKKGKKRTRKASAFAASLSVGLLGAPAALLIEQCKGVMGGRGPNRENGNLHLCSSSFAPPITFFFFTIQLPCLTLLLLSSPAVSPSPLGSPGLPLERDSWHKTSLIISPLSWLCLQDSRREWRSSRPWLVSGWQKIHPGHRALGSLGKEVVKRLSSPAQ